VTAPAPATGGRRTAALVVAGLAVLAVLALAVVGGGGGEEVAAVAPGEVSTDGAALPVLDDPADDAAVGQPAPTLRGADYDGTPVTAPVDGRPTVLLFLAHWCPACQQEVRGVQGWVDDGDEPDDIAFVAVSTGVDPGRDNYPPDEWLAREGWTLPTIVDDEEYQAGRAYGLPAYPYWVFVDDAGTVVGRHIGGLSTDQLEQVLDFLRDVSA
jgi:cytochrome c biogenesis protein CcmG, thiol:disulfide interchange protein DsbE